MLGFGTLGSHAALMELSDPPAMKSGGLSHSRMGP